MAENAKRLIKEKGLKQKHVAALAGYDEKKFSAKLNGSSIIREKDIIRIAKALNVTPNELYGIDSA